MTNVLIVEDEQAIRRFLRTALEADGLRVYEAETLQRGLLEAATRKPDLIILDLGLPDGDGIDFIRDLRQWSAIPVIVLSARSEESDKIAALDAGADDYLSKPFGIGELQARLRVALRRHASGTSPSRWHFSNVKVDIAARLVHRGDEEIHLTPIEFRLLAVLLNNAGKVLDAAPVAQSGLGTKRRRTQPLSANLHGTPAPETGTGPGTSASFSDRNRDWLSVHAMTLS